MSLGEKIKEYRGIKNMTQAKLGNATMISPQQICYYEADKAQPSTNTFLSICHVLGVTPNDLLADRITVPPLPQDLASQLNFILQAMDPDMIRKLSDLVDQKSHSDKKE